MKVVRGGRVVDLGPSDVDALVEPYPRVVLDVGAGDGRFALRYAREHPDSFVFGLDIRKESMADAAGRAGRKPARGGVRNVSYVWASAQQPPGELAGRADTVFVTLPWGRLLEGLALAEHDVLDGLVAVAAPGAEVRIVINLAVWEREVPRRVTHLPALTPEHAATVLAPAYGRRGLAVTETRMLERTEAREIRSPWARRIGSSREYPPFLLLTARTEETTGPAAG